METYHNNEANVRNTLSKLKLIGEIKSLTESRFMAHEEIQPFSKKYESLTKSEFMAYEEGKLRQIVKGFMSEKQTSLFNQSGNIIEKNEYNIDNEGIHSASGNHSKYIYSYDDKGNEIECNRYRVNGALDYKIITKFDTIKKVFEIIEYFADGSINRTYMSKHDENGNLIEWIAYNSENKWEFTMKSFYDHYGNEYKRIDESSIFGNFKTMYKYDDWGNVIEECVYRPDMHWDISSNIDPYLSGGTLEGKNIYKYRFDHNHNWISKIKFKHSFSLIIEREIVYY